jgi:PmbA protein
VDRKDIEGIVAQALKASAADETLVLVNANERALTRFSENGIHQNVSENDLSLTVQAAVGKKVGVAAGNVNAPADIAAIADKALAIARASTDKEDYAGLAAPLAVADVKAFSEATAECTPEARADVVGGIIRAAEAAKMKAAGSFMTEKGVLALGNSKGVSLYYPSTDAELVTVVMGEDSSGYAEWGGWDIATADFNALAEEAVRRAEMGKNPHDLKPGAYDLIVEPYAIGELFTWLAFVVFGTKAYQEGRSLLSKRLGAKLMGDNITIVDDGLSPEVIPLPFDFEGTPRRRVNLIDRGVARELCYDLATGAKDGKPSTGHNLGPGSSEGPIPLRLCLEAGKSSVADMIASMERGLYVSRFHYVNGYVEPMQAVFTGMTRDGSYWVEDGKIKYGVKNLRWTESMLKAFSNVKALGKERALVNASGGIMTLSPAVYFKDFTFTGTTEH